MTLVRTLQTIPNSDGTRHPAKGIFVWTPTERRIIKGALDEVVLPVGFVIELDSHGGFEVEVAATGLDWVWRVDERIDGLRTKTTYVVVPPDGPVNFTDLIPVNPSSLLSVSKPEPIWYIHTDDLAEQARLARIAAEKSESAVTLRQVVDGKINDEGRLILTREDGTTIDAGQIVAGLKVGTVTTGP